MKVSEADQLNSVACGEIGGLMLGATDLPIGSVPVDDSGHYGTAWLHDNGDGDHESLDRPDRCGRQRTAVPSGATIPVAIQNFAFEPATVAARAGDTIVFTNNDSTRAYRHPGVHWEAGSNRTRSTQDTTYTLTIDEPGMYPFFCELHPGMTGTILASE